MEAIEIVLHPNNMNKEEDFSLSRSLEHSIQMLKERKKTQLKEQWLTPSWFNNPTNVSFHCFPPHSSHESDLHYFPLPSSGTSICRLHPSSYWLTHIFTPL